MGSRPLISLTTYSPLNLLGARLSRITVNTYSAVNFHQRYVSSSSKANTHSWITPGSSNLRSKSFLLPQIRHQSTSSTAKPPPSTTTTKSSSTTKDLLKLLKLARPERTPLIIALLLLLITSSISMSIPLIIGKFLDTGSTTTLDEDGKEITTFTDSEIYGLSMTQFFSVITGVFIIGAIANSGRVIILKTIGERLVARLRTKTLKSSLEQDSAYLDTQKVGDLISRLSSDASIVSKSITANVSDGLRALISGTVGISMMSFVSWKLTGIMLLLTPPLGVMAFFYGRKIRNLSKQLQTSVGELTKVAEEQLNATRTIQAYGGERLEVKKYSTAVRDVFQIGFKEAYTSGAFYGITGFIANIGLITLLGIGSSMIKNGSLTVGELSSFMMYAVYTGSSMFGLSNFYSELMKGSGAASRIFELNERKSQIPVTQGIKPTLKDLSSSIVFQNVKFTYPTRPTIPVFNDLNLYINPGEHICIVGPSGSGKSTIASLLLRFYDPVSGTVKLNSQDLKSFNLRSYRQQIGYVQQEPSLFSGSILENITYNIPEYKDSDLQAALTQSNALKFINEFPDGLSTLVGPKGAQLSGGQKQRISLARSLLLNPKLLILDESTSALDTNSERIIAETLNQRCEEQGLTVVSIAHRLSTIKFSSRVIVLGKDAVGVVETGPFDQLYADPNSELRLLLAKNEEGDSGKATNSEKSLQELELDVQEQESIERDIDERVKKDLSLNQ
ncbi:hypothetical protein WICPIJ_001342 [Wickerhamomyces pijperi]|uniref:Uncharacterized protein n=1 Tax=Wickerhamomyces pijperi TaxID=599730 RepID=A0A9P8QDQ4_WICPI|nr:hypothetical protein WICPIJ_001342 [Wickerhamomyces pijperi]